MDYRIKIMLLLKIKVICHTTQVGVDWMKKANVILSQDDHEFTEELYKVFHILGIECHLDVNAEGSRDSNRYDYVIINSRTASVENVECSGYCFINMDANKENLVSIYGNIVTYGFGGKNTITISSTGNEDDGFVYCLQRFIDLNDFSMLEPQEIMLQGNFASCSSIYSAMVGITIALLQGRNVVFIEDKYKTSLCEKI